MQRSQDASERKHGKQWPWLKLFFVTGRIHCVECGRATKKSFNQGHCFPCFRSLASCDRCITSPELCHYDAGTCREPEWGEAHCMQPHVVYLANSSGLKVQGPDSVNPSSLK